MRGSARCRVWTMSGTRLLAAIILSSVSMVPLLAQEARGTATTDTVSIEKLAPPVYPGFAKQALITGDVLLELSVRVDGSIEAANARTGHPLVKQAALDSAQHSQFVCRACDQESRPIQIIYSFQLGPAVYCTELPAPRVAQDGNHVTVYDRPVGTCDLAYKIVEKKVRSIKCMYLWKCGVADWHEEPLNRPH